MKIGGTSIDTYLCKCELTCRRIVVTAGSISKLKTFGYLEHYIFEGKSVYILTYTIK